MRVAALVIWPILVFDIYAGATIGPILVVAGIVNFFRPSDGTLWMFGEPVTTLRQKIEWMLTTVPISVTFIALAVWHFRWSRCRTRNKV